MSPPVCHVETMRRPGLYTPAQIRLAFDICYALGRGKLILTEEPKGQDDASR